MMPNQTTFQIGHPPDEMLRHLLRRLLKKIVVGILQATLHVALK